MLNQRRKVAILSALIIVASIGVITSTSLAEKDEDMLSRLRTYGNAAPDMAYPTKDIKGQKIPKFGYLVVMPDCKSCSDFRRKSQVFMRANPQRIFLVLTPDLESLNDSLNSKHCYVSVFDKKSEYAKLLPGMYTHE